ncbi:hypothetical protein VTK73DRAFT_2559 [Phialemonium thermophilum]|uniref:OTU domain-containing protein n=1 Tax=Phialemonium thermophilum TaxID=223376 RepID=A0ABR3X497_9PEZI
MSFSNQRPSSRRRSDLAGQILTNVQDDVKLAVMQHLYYEELETIRRNRPILDPSEYPIQDLRVRRKATAPPSALEKKESLKATPLVQPTPPLSDAQAGSSSNTPVCVLDDDPEADVTVIALASSSDEDGDEASSEENTPDSSYAKEMNSTMRYHDMTSNPGQWPSPAAGLRFRVQAFLEDHQDPRLQGAKLEDVFTREISVATEDLYQWVQGHQDGAALALPEINPWRAGAQSKAAAIAMGNKYNPPLLRGLPLVEDVVFLRNHNSWAEMSNGTCYWTALALLIYNDPVAWLRVKAEHREHVQRVLSSPINPKYCLYRQLNEMWFPTVASTARGMPPQGPVKANLWQVLNLPGLYVPMNMLDITADLYNVYMVVYSYKNRQFGDVVYETRTRGAYNSRHLFLLYVNGNHFQPMIPNDYVHWEFKMPRVTQLTTKGLPLAEGRNDGIRHPWRSEFRREGGQAPPLLIDRPFNIDSAASAVAMERRRPSGPAPAPSTSDDAGKEGEGSRAARVEPHSQSRSDAAPTRSTKDFKPPPKRKASEDQEEYDSPYESPDESTDESTDENMDESEEDSDIAPDSVPKPKGNPPKKKAQRGANNLSHWHDSGKRYK